MQIFVCTNVSTIKGEKKYLLYISHNTKYTFNPMLKSIFSQFAKYFGSNHREISFFSYLNVIITYNMQIIVIAMKFTI